MSAGDLLGQRRAGILLHITSLPGSLDFADMGAEAYRFIDFLATSGITVWQILPLGPTGLDLSPYQCFSAHAGNPQLISLEWLQKRGWLSHQDGDEPEPGDSWNFRLRSLQKAYDRFSSNAGNNEKQRFESFIEDHDYWLRNYALYTVLRENYEMKSWVEWPDQFRNRDPAALSVFSEKNRDMLTSIKFQQFAFFEQWLQLRDYANQHGVRVLGDMPIFVAHDSADVWAHPEYFELDEMGHAKFVAGTPPDYFSETGQRWGNPQYRWNRIETDNFSWWLDRFRTQASLFDGVRIDHFRGLSAYWQIPAEDTTAENGRWVKAPGDKLLQSLTRSFPQVSMIAEDLGTITTDVIALRDKYKLPGMNVLQFAFDGSPDNPYLPKNHKKHSVVYTGTHDNDTSLSWFQSQSKDSQRYILEQLITNGEQMPWSMVNTAFSSISQLAVILMQDILGLGAGHRMNLPGTIEGNWRWRFSWDELDSNLPKKLAGLLERADRMSDVIALDDN